MNDFKVVKRSMSNDNVSDQRRRFARRDHDVCMINVDGHPYPVVDWSQGGVLFEGDTRLFESGQIVSMILRFKLNDVIEDIRVIGEIVRKNSKYVATKFYDVPEKTAESFDKVIGQS